MLYKWCGWRESNPHTSRYQNLNLARLPVPPHPRKTNQNVNAATTKGGSTAAIHTSGSSAKSAPELRMNDREKVGWTKGFEPSTAGVTILSSTN